MEFNVHFACRFAPYGGEAIESTVSVPRIQGKSFLSRERPIALCENAIDRHHCNLLSRLRRGKHGWADAKPTSKFDRVSEFLVASTKPVQDWDARGGIASQTLQDFGRSATTVNRKNLPTRTRAVFKNFVKDIELIIPKWFTVGPTVQTNFANVRSCIEQLSKERQLMLSLLRKLGMQTKGGSDAR